MNVHESKVTEMTFGLGLQTGAKRTLRMDEHVRALSAEGWRLVAVNQNAFELPVTWRFFWERPTSKSSDPEIA